MANLLKIKELLKEKKITIKSFSADIGMTEQGLQKLIRDNSTKIETLELIAKKLNVSVVVFFDENTQANNALPLTDSQFTYFIDKIEAQAKEIGRLEQELENWRKKSLNTTGAEGVICADAVG